MSEAEVVAEIDAAVAEAGAAGPQDMGKVMALLKPRVAGRADMGKVSALVKAAAVLIALTWQRAPRRDGIRCRCVT